MRKLALAAMLATAILASATLAAEGSRQESTYKLTQDHPSSSTGERFRFDYVNPEDPEAKPPAVERVATILPKGAHFDARVPGSCTASDAELVALGSDACPATSEIGGGVITVDTGVPGPARIVTADTVFFNNATDPEGEFIYLNTVRGSGARNVVRADVRHRRTVTVAMVLPGTPPDGGAIDTVDVDVEAVSRRFGGERRHYITTPDGCPERGSWRTRVRFTYQDGVTQTVPDRTDCENN